MFGIHVTLTLTSDLGKYVLFLHEELPVARYVHTCSQVPLAASTWFDWLVVQETLSQKIKCLQNFTKPINTKTKDQFLIRFILPSISHQLGKVNF